MAVIKLGGGGMWVPSWWTELDSAATFSSGFLMDASTEKAAFLGRFFHKDGAAKNVNKVGFRFGGVTKDATTDIQVSLQDVLATAQNPDETADQSALVGNANITANTFREITLGASRSLTPGDLVAVVWEYSTFVAGDSIVISAVDMHVNFTAWHGNYGRLKTASWGGPGDQPSVVLGCDDGTYGTLAGAFPGLSAYGVETLASNTTPDEIALPIIFPWRCTTDRAWVMIDPEGDFDVVLYEGTTARRTVSFDTDNTRNTQFGPAPNILFVPWSSHYTFEPNVQHYLAIKPTTTTAAGTIVMTVSAADMLQSMDGGPDFHYATRVDAGAWTATTTKRVMAGISINGVDSGSSGGGIRLAGHGGLAS